MRVLDKKYRVYKTLRQIPWGVLIAEQLWYIM
jgi:hypothetical protein